MALIISLLLIILACILLLWLSIIDLKIGLLPNPLVLLLFLSGLVFHLISPVFYLSHTDMVLGAVMGAGTLLCIRFIANRILNTDSLGLGDVKLMGAAGVWLGSYFVPLALIIGAAAGLLHGLGYAFYMRQKSGSWPDMSTLSIPAGPGFAVGIFAAGCMLFQDLVLQAFQTLGVL